MIHADGRAETPLETLTTIFERLFENEFATLDGIAISLHDSAGMHYIDEATALDAWLRGQLDPAGTERPGSPACELHTALHASLPDYDCVISGWSRHLRALLLEGMDLPRPTSMMRKRGISDLAAHLVPPTKLTAAELPATVSWAQVLARENEMRHVLLVTTEGMVVVAGGPPFEAMAHWHNVEFAARVACLEAEERASHAAIDRPSD